MKGVVFTEFMAMVEDRFSADMVDELIDAAELPHGGSYTAVGTYDHQELVAMVVALSERTQIAVPDLLVIYGEHLFTRFYQLYPNFFNEVTTTFHFLKNIETYIHVEVKKLYPDAELPSFNYQQPTPDRLMMTYHSPRHFGLFALGLIRGCIHHFGESIEVEWIDRSTEAGGDLLFTLTHRPN